MLYQLPNGKVIYISIEDYLDLTDEDIQMFMSMDCGEYVRDPFKGSAVESNTKEKYYDFEFLAQDDELLNNISSDDDPFDDIIDLSNNTEI